jgi:hypothetical protein
MPDIKTAYGASSNLTITLASLATSATWLAGRQSAEVDNTSDKYFDFRLSGKVTVGTINTEIRVYVVGLMDDSTYPNSGGAADAAFSLAAAGIGSGFLKLAAVMSVDATTSDRPYPFDAGSVRALFNGVLPSKFFIWVTQNTGQPLNATGSNHQITVKPEFATST